MSQQFGYAKIEAQAQSAEGAIPGANPVRPSFLAGSACVIRAAFFDNTGAPMAPTVLAYDISDVATGSVILASTPIANPLAVQPVIVTAAQNAMVSNSQPSETHEAVFAITDQNGNGPFKARCLFDVLIVPAS